MFTGSAAGTPKPRRGKRDDEIVLVAKAFLRNYAVEHGLTFATGGQRARVAEPGAECGDLGRRQAGRRQRPGIDRYPECLAAADA